MEKSTCTFKEMLQSMTWMIVPFTYVSMPFIGSVIAQNFFPKSEDFFIVLFFIFSVIIFFVDLLYAEYKTRNLTNGEINSEVGMLPTFIDTDSGHCSDMSCH